MDFDWNVLPTHLNRSYYGTNQCVKIFRFTGIFLIKFLFYLV